MNRKPNPQPQVDTMTTVEIESAVDSARIVLNQLFSDRNSAGQDLINYVADTPDENFDWSRHEELCDELELCNMSFSIAQIEYEELIDLTKTDHERWGI